MKDNALGAAFKSYLNERYGGILDILDVQMDTKAARIDVQAQLAGEHEQIRISIEHYDLESTREGRFIVLHAASSSRVWIDRLLALRFVGKKFKLPGAVAALL